MVQRLRSRVITVALTGRARAATWLKAMAYTSVVDYNHLETSFLLTSVCILVLGMMFSSRGFPPGSTGISILTALTIVLILASFASFSTLLVFEVYRSFRLSALDGLARELETEAIEAALRSDIVRRRLARRNSKSSSSTARGTDGSASDGKPQPRARRRRTSIAERISEIRMERSFRTRRPSQVMVPVIVSDEVNSDWSQRKQRIQSISSRVVSNDI
jgi:hypothetical protein